MQLKVLLIVLFKSLLSTRAQQYKPRYGPRYTPYFLRTPEYVIASKIAIDKWPLEVISLYAKSSDHSCAGMYAVAMPHKFIVIGRKPVKLDIRGRIESSEASMIPDPVRKDRFRFQCRLVIPKDLTDEEENIWQSAYGEFSMYDYEQRRALGITHWTAECLQAGTEVHNVDQDQYGYPKKVICKPKPAETAVVQEVGTVTLLDKDIQEQFDQERLVIVAFVRGESSTSG